MEPQITSVIAQAKGQSVQLLGYSVGQPITMPVTGIGEAQDVLGYYGEEIQTNDKAAIIVTKYGKGNLILISFNIEMSYGDDASLKDEDFNHLKENVFQRDVVFQEVLRKFDL